MDLRVSRTDRAPAPVGPYSQAIVAGDFVFCAGQLALDAQTGQMVGGDDIRLQTREHLAILGLLGVDRGVVALTKRDLVDDEWAALARSEVAGALHSTPLRDAPMVEVSAQTGAGLRELVAALDTLLVDASPRRD